MSKRVISGYYEVDFTYKGQRIRGAIPCQTLVDIINGRQIGQTMTNLGGEGVIRFDRFLDDQYLARHAKPNKRPSAYDADVASAVWLRKFFGAGPIHLITKAQREDYKQQRLSGGLSIKGRPCANNTVNRELSCLSQVLGYAAELGYLIENPVAGLKRLPPVHRPQYWLTRGQFEKLIAAAAEYEGGKYVDFIEFVTYTGTRLSEALSANVQDIDWKRKEIRLTTLKKRRRGRAERFLSITEIGPRLERLLSRLKPHQQTGNFFARKDGLPWKKRSAEGFFANIRKRAGLEQFRIHDLRHTFAMHRAMTKVTFRQLQIELGHSSPQSIQSYLDQAVRFEAKESLFYQPSAGRGDGGEKESRRSDSERA